LSLEKQTQIDTLIAGLEAGLAPYDALDRAGLGVGQRVPSEISLSVKSSRIYGSSLLPTLREIASSWQSETLLQSELDGEFSAPRATIKLVTWLPIAALVLALLMGFDLTATLRSPVSMVSVAMGLVLIWLARRWSLSILRKAQPIANADILNLRQLCIALSSGATVKQAIEQVTLPAETLALLAEDLAHSRSTGASALPAVRGRIEQLSQKNFDHNRRRVREAGVRLTLPLGVAVLPAMVFLVVIPMFNSAAITPTLSG
jgi:tight adherence protein B